MPFSQIPDIKFRFPNPKSQIPIFPSACTVAVIVRHVLQTDISPLPLYKKATNKPNTPVIPRLARVPCRFANTLAAPVKLSEAAVVVPEASEPDVPVEVLPSVPPDVAPTDGETFSGASAANLVKLSMVRDLFFAGLFRRTYKHEV